MLDSDIKQVAGRQPALPAGKPQLQLPSQQHSTQLLQKRLQEAMPSSSLTPSQAATASAARGSNDRPSLAAIAPQPLQAAVGLRPTPSGSLPPAAMPPTPAMSMHHDTMQSSHSQVQVDPPASSQPGIILAQHQQPALATSQQSDSHAVASSQSLLPRLSRASNGYLMINHPYPPAPQPQLPAGSAAGAGHHEAAAGSMPAASARSSSPVPMPTQMERQQSMHIHPRHLAFQHYHAIQQRQQMARKHSTNQAAASAAAGRDSAAMDGSSGQSANQEAAVRCVASLAVVEHHKLFCTGCHDLHGCHGHC